MNDGLLPKSGVETSSFKVAVVSALAPVLALAVVVAGLVFVEDDIVRALLADAFKYLLTAAVAAGGAVGFQYVKSRGEVSVAKLEAYKAINAPAQTTPSASVEITQETKP